MYTVLAEIRREVIEKYECTVEANDEEEALDIVYHSMSEYPDSEIRLNSRRRFEERTLEVKKVDVELPREEIVGENDDGDDHIA